MGGMGSVSWQDTISIPSYCDTFWLWHILHMLALWKCTLSCDFLTKMIQNESCRVVWSEDGARRRRSQPACRGHASHEDALDVQDAPVQRYRFEKSKLVLSHHMASRTIIIITHQHQHQHHHHHHHHHHHASASASTSSSSSSASSSRIITYHHVSSRISTYHHVSSRIITYQHVSARISTEANTSKKSKAMQDLHDLHATVCRGLHCWSHIALTFQLLRFTRKRVPTSHHESLYSAHESASHRKPKCKTNRIKSMKNRRSKSKTNAFKMISHDLSRFHADLKAMFLTSWKTIDTPNSPRFPSISIVISIFVYVHFISTISMRCFDLPLHHVLHVDVVVQKHGETSGRSGCLQKFHVTSRHDTHTLTHTHTHSVSKNHPRS